MNRIERERKTIELMINIFCRDEQHEGKELCEHCTDMLSYANYRLSKCPWG